MKTIITITLFLFVLSSCKTNSTGTQHTPQTIQAPPPLIPIQGSWQLVQITGGFSGRGIPVSSTNEVITLHENGTFACNVSDMIKVSEGTFIISEKFSRIFNRNCFYLQLNNNNIGSITNIVDVKDDSMTMSTEVNDGFTYIFKRK